jgi:hypothetical protein
MMGSLDLGLFELFQLLLPGDLPADDPACLVQNFQGLLGRLALGSHLWRLGKTLDEGLVLEKFVVE